MQMKLRFLGAAQNVTGSRHLLEVNNVRVLVDCGLYQERPLRSRNWQPFDIPPESIDAVFLTHAHLDHCGLLPKLVQQGFKGRIYCTQATMELARIVMLDSARLQMEDAQFKRKRHEREGRSGPFPISPLYSVEDVEVCFSLFCTLDYGQHIDIGFGIDAVLYEAGHVLGSAVVKITASNPHESRSILFSGDLGRPHRPIVRNPAPIYESDYVLVESTYGDHVHHRYEEVKNLVADAINRVQKRGGNIIVPSFALERSQELLYYINELLLEGAIPHLMVFLDSPMAAEITKVFQRHQELYDSSLVAHMRNHESPFEFPGLKITESADESKAINHIKGTVVIISGSGMCTGGRIKHHLVNNITRKESAILFVGYQAMGTLGRHIVAGAKKVRIHGASHRVRAKVKQIRGFSAHADKTEILAWLQAFRRPPRQVFVVHGEVKSATHFRDYLAKETGWNVMAPAYMDEIVLD